MGKQYQSLTDSDREFAVRQRLFFIASASGHEVSLAPKGEDSIIFLDDKTLLLMDFPGSTNRTGRDIEEGGDITIMFCSFDDEPRVLRLFCTGQAFEKNHPEFDEMVRLFPDGNPAIVRQVFRLSVRAVENSCGLSVPVMRFEKLRENGVRHWAEQKARTAGKKR
jgi:hypothetical protein